MVGKYGRGSRRRYQGLWLGQKFAVRAVRVLDGRIVHVESVQRPHDYRVRLYGINVPDKSRNEPYWKECSDYLSGLVLDREFIMEVKEFDIKNRQIVASLLDDAVPYGSASHALVAGGWAFCESGPSVIPGLRELESNARSLGLGVWRLQ